MFNVQLLLGFKPYYKWITFNTESFHSLQLVFLESFKPYYKWITFNTLNLGRVFKLKDANGEF